LPAPRPSSIRVHRKCAHCAKEYLAAMGRSPSRNESLSPEWRAAVAQDRARPGESRWLGEAGMFLARPAAIQSPGRRGELDRTSPRIAGVSRRCKAREPKGYALAKTIVHGLLVLIT